MWQSTIKEKISPIGDEFKSSRLLLLFSRTMLKNVVQSGDANIEFLA